MRTFEDAIGEMVDAFARLRAELPFMCFENVNRPNTSVTLTRDTPTS